MESHVLIRQSNNKRCGREAGPLGAKSPLHRYIMSCMQSSASTSAKMRNNIAVVNRWSLKNRANAMPPVEGEKLTSAKLG